jgi:hypothetical protein
MKLTPTEPDIQTIVDRIRNGDIDLQPDFQRQEVWSTNKKKRLIDTVLRGWSIPPVHLVETSENQLEVLDGQQRLAALRDFVHNRFSIDGRITPSDDSVAALHGRFYRQLDQATRRRIDQFPIRCFRITDYTPEEPSELFYRLNQPTMLTAGEQRNALFGPARQQLKELVGSFEASGNTRETLGFSNVRLAYDDVLARLLYFLEVRNFGSKSTEARISERFRSQQPFPDDIMTRAQAAIRHFSTSRTAAESTRFNKASLLSWLIFFSRCDDNVFVPGAIQAYIDASHGKYPSHSVTEAVSLFADRASLRVTDVSSVVYRDFALCYIYRFTLNGVLSSRVNGALIDEVQDALSERDEATFEYTVSQLVDVEAWSHSL